jgi:hypothetical protein
MLCGANALTMHLRGKSLGIFRLRARQQNASQGYPRRSQMNKAPKYGRINTACQTPARAPVPHVHEQSLVHSRFNLPRRCVAQR